MPTYQYRCTACGHDLEAVQKFSDAALTECPNCGGPLRKVFNAVGVVFKGSGFYRTDNRKGSADGGSADGAGDRKNAADGGDKKTGEKVGESGSGDGGKKEPAPATAASGRNGSNGGSGSNGSGSNGSGKGSAGAGTSSSTGSKSSST